MSTPAPSPRAAVAPPADPPPLTATTPNLPSRKDPAQQGSEVLPGREVSTPGPRTPEGKAVAARNATTHGLFARDVVLPALGEDPAAFDALLTRLCEQLPPRNLLERHYLEQIAAASWRLRRLHRWQAQIYEDDALTEDERLDKLDKTLRHETTLTRQIDRAVRTLNRDLKWLFEGRATDEAHYQRDLTPAEARETPELAIEVQRDIWRRLRPVSDADLADAPFDDTAPDGTAPDAAAPGATQNCENEPPASGSDASPRPHPAPVDLVHGGPQAPLAAAQRGRGRGRHPRRPLPPKAPPTSSSSAPASHSTKGNRHTRKVDGPASWLTSPRLCPIMAETLFGNATDAFYPGKENDIVIDASQAVAGGNGLAGGQRGGDPGTK